jgi:hypothetical protein
MRLILAIAQRLDPRFRAPIDNESYEEKDDKEYSGPPRIAPTQMPNPIRDHAQSNDGSDSHHECTNQVHRARNQ